MMSEGPSFRHFLSHFSFSTKYFSTVKVLMREIERAKIEYFRRFHRSITSIFVPIQGIIFSRTCITIGWEIMIVNHNYKSVLAILFPQDDGTPS